MGEKKKPGRFTLQFNLEDPQQRMVSEFLEQQGRRKAQLITSAILQYIQCPRLQEDSCNLPKTDKESLEQLVLSILKKYPQFADISSGHPIEKEVPLIRTRQVADFGNDSMSDDAIKAISETLAAFQQG